jgi:ketosteroid isomerase-like protein
VVLEEIHDAGAHKSIIHASSTAETKIGPYANEYMLVLKFTKDGKKVTEFNEFVDSAYSEPFFKALENETSSK